MAEDWARGTIKETPFWLYGNNAKNNLRGFVMANLPKCTECEYNNLMEVTCRLYPTGIPDDIFVEIKKCDYYKKRKEKYNKSDEDLPVAKGR